MMMMLFNIRDKIQERIDENMELQRYSIIQSDHDLWVYAGGKIDAYSELLYLTKELTDDHNHA